MPRGTTAARHLVSYIQQDAMWDADLDAAPGWPPCILQTSMRPHSAHVSQLMLERPSSVVGFQPVGNFLAVQILAEQARAPNRTGEPNEIHNPITAGARPAYSPPCCVLLLPDAGHVMRLSVRAYAALVYLASCCCSLHAMFPDCGLRALCLRQGFLAVQACC